MADLASLPELQRRKLVKATDLMLRIMSSERCVKLTFNFHKGDLSAKYNVEYSDKIEL